ncbi:antibiotic biosynthesis monooxygenase [Streptomyces sp. NPDC048389]|uniref:antibiotic biosynthesis monooxygenase n=1 Tax=Streptomyces sp. NPDC048389 TaxID=3154622 RepID=UPI003455A44C
MNTSTYPDIGRPDARTVIVSTRYAGDSASLRRMADADTAEYDSAPLVQGLVGLSWFLSLDATTLLTCAQWTSDTATDAFLRVNGFAAGFAGPPRYRIHRSLTQDVDVRVPGCLVTAAFDVDGPERQQHFAESVIAAQSKEEAHPGAISAHFLLSTDGSRVLLYTEWSSPEAHEEAAEAGGHDAVHDIFSGTPGVRLTHGSRYRLHRSLSRPAG